MAFFPMGHTPFQGGDLVWVGAVNTMGGQERLDRNPIRSITDPVMGDHIKEREGNWRGRCARIRANFDDAVGG